MNCVLMSPAARRVLVGGVLLAWGSVAPLTAADGPVFRPTSEPVLQPVPAVAEAASSETEIIPFLLSHSPTNEKLVLVSAEIDAQAEQPQVLRVEKGSSSRRLRKLAINDLPQQSLTSQEQRVVDDVLSSISVFRRLPAFQCELDPRVHEYFTRHPDVAVSIWRAMAISQLEMTQTDPLHYSIDTRDGTTGVVTVLHQTRESCVIHCDGMFKSPYLKNAIHAKSIMHLKTRIGTDREGRAYVTHQADLFVSFPSQKIGTIAKLISPVSNAIIDRNFQEISLFVHVMWQAMAKQPGWVEQIAARLDGVPEARRDELLKLTADVYITAQANRHKRAGLPASSDRNGPRTDRPTRTTAARPVDVTR